MEAVMGAKPLSHEQCRKVLDALDRYSGNQASAATFLGIPRKTLVHQATIAKRRSAEGQLPAFEVAQLPSEDLSLDELLALRRQTFIRKDAGAQARKLIPVKVRLDGPIGILHFGDPHVDDNGCDFPRLEADVALCKTTPGLLAGNVGDLHNNWIGRLARLYGNQTATAKHAWMLVEWLVRELDWLYLVLGNHDCWSGQGDPLNWIKHAGIGVLEPHGARLNLTFPNGKNVRINARHDFTGHSMWNPNHGPVKAIKGGWRDHILTCGHKHETGFGPPIKDPSSGLISWPLRCAGYKTHDEYAAEKGLPDQNISPSILTVIDPGYADDDPRLITPFLSAEEGADFLCWKRKKAGAQAPVGANGKSARRRGPNHGR